MWQRPSPVRQRHLCVLRLGTQRARLRLRNGWGKTDDKGPSLQTALCCQCRMSASLVGQLIDILVVIDLFNRELSEYNNSKVPTLRTRGAATAKLVEEGSQ